ncbi:MAG: heme anaerobic degradation radical SAM methyltransferase ChuW/HutW [Phycisphaeraceae bacterium]
MDTLTEVRHRRDVGLPPWRWFDRKVRGHMQATAELPRTRLQEQDSIIALDRQMVRPAIRRRVIYVHVPFCKRICTFCAFFRRSSASADLQAYTQALLTQIRRSAATTWAQNGPPFSAVYFGGGTPTSLDAGQLAGLVNAIYDRFPLSGDCEFTVECRFDGIDEAYLSSLFDAGVNRLSFGVQSFDTGVRQAVGRIADRDRVLDTLALAERVGFKRISTDLIYNLPGQSHASWAQDIRLLLTTPATAASIYALIPMRGSALVKQINAGRVDPLGDIAHEYDLFMTAYNTLVRRPGWRRLSFHHFGDYRQESNTYNRVRAGGVDTLGLGCGAGGQIENLAYMNPMSVPHYIEAQARGQHGNITVYEEPSPTVRLREAYRLIESDGISRGRLLELLPGIEPIVESLMGAGLIVEDAGILTPTREGCFWGYNLAAILTEAIADTLARQSDYIPDPKPSDPIHQAGVHTCSSSSIA